MNESKEKKIRRIYAEMEDGATQEISGDVICLNAVILIEGVQINDTVQVFLESDDGQRRLIKTAETR